MQPAVGSPGPHFGAEHRLAAADDALLALVTEVLKLHGTTLDVDSEVGRGSVFSFRLAASASFQRDEQIRGVGEGSFQTKDAAALAVLI